MGNSIRTFLFSVGKDDQYVFESDDKTNELYLNGKKIVTEIGFSRSQKIMGWLVSISIIAQGIMSIISFAFNK